MRRAAAALLLSASMGAGCSLLVDTGDLTGGSVSNGASDASSGGDGTVPPSSDAGAEAGEGGPDAGSPCATAHLFCDDFDQGPNALGDKWTSVSGLGTSTIAIDTSRSISAPGSLRAVLSAADDSLAFVRKDLAISGENVTIAFDLFVEVSPTGYTEIDYLTLYPTPTPGGVSSQGLTLAHTGQSDEWRYFKDNSTARKTTIALPQQKWRHVVARFLPGPLRSTFMIGSDQEVTLNLDSSSLTGLSIRLGIVYTQGTFNGVASSVWFDNVVIDN